MQSAPSVTPSRPPLSTAFSSLRATAEKSLSANIVNHPTGSYLSAGGHQFRSFWTRDFCWSIAGLLDMGRPDVVRDHLQLLFDNVREDGQLPRAIDTMSPKTRVVRATLAYAVGLKWKQQPPVGTLKPEYTEQNGHPVIDSNSLAILGALTYAESTGDEAFITKNKRALRDVFSFYANHLDPSDGLITQPPFADWQDSANRSGKTLYTNVIWAAVLQKLADRNLFGVTQARAAQARASIQATFFDENRGVLRSMANAQQVSLDGNLLALELGVVTDDNARKLYEALKLHKLWSMAGGIPGAVTTPDYKRSHLNWTMVVAGLNHYHDRIAWSWLIALSAKTAARMGDTAEAHRILKQLSSHFERDKLVAEIYDPTRQMRPWRRWLYRSETPFSWGAAMAIDATDFVAHRG